MLAVHVGVSHLYGFGEEDIAVGSYLAFEVSERTISRWRSGDFDPRLSSQLILVWFAFFQVGRDTGTIRKSLLTELANSPLYGTLVNETGGNLKANADDTLREIIQTTYSDFEYTSLPSTENNVYSLETSDCHLSMIRSAHRNDNSQFIQLVSLLELCACYPDDADDMWNSTALENIRSRKFPPLIVPGAWPKTRGEAPPSWVIEAVRTRGARFSYASSGFTPGWFLVMDSDEVERAVTRAGYETKFVYIDKEDGKISLGFLLEFPDKTSARITYTYHLSDIDSVNSLSAMLSMGIVRIDFYSLKANSSLCWSHSIGRRLPPELITRGRDAVRKWQRESAQIDQMHWTADQRLRQMALMERNIFERLTISQKLLREDPESPYSGAYRRFLEVAHVTTVQRSSNGIVDDSLYDEAVNFLHAEMAKATPALDPIDLSILPNETAYIQFFLVSGYLHALVAYYADIDHTICQEFEFSGEVHFSFSPSDARQVSDELACGLLRLKSLQENGINSLIISLGPDIYNFPFHDALLELGFLRVSYTHRLGSLAAPPDIRPGAVACISGHAAPEGDYLAAVTYELAVLRRIHGPATVNGMLRETPAIVHWAGHGLPGSAAFEGGMRMGPLNADFVSSAKILADYDCSSTSVVFLSACSTGRGEYSFDNLAAAVPLDVAFIEAGASSVLATSARVNDIVSAFFAIVFHFALIKLRIPIWDAYILARDCTKSRNLDPTLVDLRIVLEMEWSTWCEDLNRAMHHAPDDWRLFRLSGRYWN